MKRAGNLFCKIAEIENLELAFWKAQRGKTGKKEVRLFRDNLSVNLMRLREDLLSGNYSLGNYHYFKIYDPKERMICASDFRERVIQHAVINVCEPHFEKYQIFDSYACRKGKGVDSCLKRTQEFCARFKWYLKLDIHKYFNSIHHPTLLRLLNRRFKDARLMDFFSQLLDSYEVALDCGLPIGSLCSQYFANLYLGMFDHYVKDVCRISGYVRYMDDFIVFGNDKENLKETKRQVEEFLLNQMKLSLNEPIINKTECGIPFLSYRVRLSGLRLSLKAKRRFVRKIKVANRMKSADRALPLLAFVIRADSEGFRRKVIFGTSFKGSNRVCRGGSWNNNARNCRSANRNNNSPSNRNNNIGFRVALVPAQGNDGCLIEQSEVSIPEFQDKNERPLSQVGKCSKAITDSINSIELNVGEDC